MTLNEAETRIAELEEYIGVLEKELEKLRKVTPAGRPVHGESWQASYDHWVELYEEGHTIVEIMDKAEISRRTHYRYLTHYKELLAFQAKNLKEDLTDN